MGSKSVGADAFGIGEAGQDRQDAGGTKLGRFLNNEIRPRLLDRREEQPQVGRVLLRRCLGCHRHSHLPFARLSNFGSPFPIMSVKQGNPVARPLSHHTCQVVRLIGQRDLRTGPKGCVDIVNPMTNDSIPQPATDGRVADATDLNWVDRFAPAATRPYLRLSRADRPAGTWLLLLPCLWGLALAVAADAEAARWGDMWWAAACAIGAFLMRGAGCTWNDLADQDFDAEVERTRSRPLPSGQVSRKGATIWMCVQALLAFCILMTFNLFTILLACASLGFVAIYPFAKRFTWWPQVFLGLAFNWGALVGWSAINGSLGWPAVVLYLAGIAWTLFYDTIYAHQDKEDDALIGVKSTALLFGEHTKKWLFGFQVVAVSLMGLAAILAMAPSGNPLATVVGFMGAWACSAPIVMRGLFLWRCLPLPS